MTTSPMFYGQAKDGQLGRLKRNRSINSSVYYLPPPNALERKKSLKRKNKEAEGNPLLQYRLYSIVYIV